MKTKTHFWSNQFFLEWEIFQAEFIEKIKTYFLYSIIFFRKPCHLWDNVGKKSVQPDRPKMTMWRMRFAWWAPKATNTPSEYVMFMAFPLQQWLHERASTLRYTYIACLVYFKNHVKSNIKFTCESIYEYIMHQSNTTNFKILFYYLLNDKITY